MRRSPRRMPHPPLSAGEWTFDGKRAPSGAPFFPFPCTTKPGRQKHMNAVSTAPPSDLRPVSSHPSGYAIDKPSPPVVDNIKPTGSQRVLLVTAHEAVGQLLLLVISRDAIATSWANRRPSGGRLLQSAGRPRARARQARLLNRKRKAGRCGTGGRGACL